MQSAPLRELTRQEIADYREHGVVCLRQVISQEWLDYVGDEFDFIMANLRRSPNHINASAKPINVPFTIVNGHLCRQNTLRDCIPTRDATFGNTI